MCSDFLSISLNVVSIVSVQNMADAGEGPAVRTQHGEPDSGGTEAHHSTAAQENKRVQIPH